MSNRRNQLRAFGRAPHPAARDVRLLAARDVRLLAAVAWALLAAQPGPAAGGLSGDWLRALNERFLAQLDAGANGNALLAAQVREGYERIYREHDPESFLPDALALLQPQFGAALASYDLGDVVRAAERFEPLLEHPDEYVAASAHYFHARALIDLGYFEEAETRLLRVTETPEELAALTPYAPHLEFLLAVCQARNLRFDAAEKTLRALRARFERLPEATGIGATQLALEVERREVGTLGEIATVMEYASDRLSVIDAARRVQARQRQALDMLDKLIEQAEQQEQQQGGGGQRGGSGRPGGSPSSPRAGLEQSLVPEFGAARPGQLHAAPDAAPGEMWGKLPDAERERILQKIQERFPSRYRQLVEQYYRSLAQQN